MKARFLFHSSIAVAMCVFAGCATYQTNVGPTPIMRAQKEIPEEQLMDVGILPFKSEELSDEEAQEAGTNNQIRKAEGHFIPYHLKNTLHQSSHWGSVRVIPTETDSIDLFVRGEIIESNGENLTLKIDVVDATEKTWFSKKYKAEATENSYTGNQTGEKDAFQNLYNAIANDMAAFKTKLTPEDIRKIRTVAKMKFAADFAPDAYRGYLAKGKKNTIDIQRLPADDDPMMARLLKIREREYMYVDALNEYYEVFYNEMWPSYENWRKLSLTEMKAIRKIKREALTKQVIGALLIAGAIAAGSSRSDNTAVIQAGMIIIGGQVILDGFNVSKQADIHEAAIQELGESFGSEMQPVVMEFEGKHYELTGSAEQQFNQWRALLRQIYFAETGFAPDNSRQNPEVKTPE